MSQSGSSSPSLTASLRGVDGRLVEALQAAGHLTDEQLQRAVEAQAGREGGARRLGAVLSELGLVDETALAEALAGLVGLPFVHLHPSMVQPEVWRRLPMSYLAEHNLLPMAEAEGWLTIAVANFTDVVFVESLKARAGCEVQVVAAAAGNIRQVRELLEAAEGAGGGVVSTSAVMHDLTGILGAVSIDEIELIAPPSAEEEADLLTKAGDSPAIKLVNHCIKTAAETRASDVHIEPGDGEVRIRFRVDGELVEGPRPPLTLLPSIVSRIKIMSNLDIAERRLPQDGGLSVTMSGRRLDLRVSTMTTRFGEKVVLRLASDEATVRGMDEVGLDPAVLDELRLATREPNGIVLVTGPTGSGKTTTLYGLLGELVTGRSNVSTIEDPVERRLAGVNQFQIDTAAGFTFPKALRSMLRQDPDTIMVGEIRDGETARLAVEAALTGHLVLSTLHTNDAVSAIPRLINMGVEGYLVAATLRGVLAQRLVRRICPHCAEQTTLTTPQAQILERLGRPLPAGQTVCRGRGCPRCQGRGHSGRVGVFEFLRLDEELLSVVAHGPGQGEVREIAGRSGMRSLLDDGLKKVCDGQIALDGLLDVVSKTASRPQAGGGLAA